MAKMTEQKQENEMEMQKLKEALLLLRLFVVPMAICNAMAICEVHTEEQEWMGRRGGGCTKFWSSLCEAKNPT